LSAGLQHNRNYKTAGLKKQLISGKHYSFFVRNFSDEEESFIKRSTPGGRQQQPQVRKLDRLRRFRRNLFKRRQKFGLKKKTFGGIELVSKSIIV